ncbi:cytochrome P450 family protein [Actinoalloteichus sp. GBA129-24]|uniref:cytochrome P450 family protein n=1 Tax=Actinoalloteichus sp. GBA129-24 TaxID=1612551 RepID=UPI000950A645|nr:cytochrome P450 [Actinoalloteichus sp. GBA129-24]APU21299.1 cytochrome P450 [Actinoalloteichus sp. GBA129-24]
MVELPGPVVAWTVTSHDHLRRLLSDPRVSKDAHRHWPGYADGEITLDSILAAWVGRRNMFGSYGGDHSRLRGVASTAFTPRRISALVPWISTITDRLLDDIATVPAGTVIDLRESFAYPLPIDVICGLFGVPDDLRPTLRQVVDGIFATTSTPDEAHAVGARQYEVISQLIDARRASPGDDLTSDLIAARDADDSRLSELELADTLLLVLVAGHETVVNLLDHAITALLTHPDQLALLRRGDRTWKDVIEETLRWQAPVANLPLRYAVEDIPLDDDIVIRQGHAILAAYAATGRDPHHHGHSAHRYDLTRELKDHLAFGHGAHYCLGAPLARLEATIALDALFTRFPDLALAVPPDELQPSESFISNGHHTLPVIPTPRDSPDDH